MICDECETVAHCSKHGCIPKHPDYEGAIEISVIFHKGQRMFAVPKQPAQQEPVAILNHAHGIHTVRSVKLNGLPDGEYNLYTSPPAQRTWVGLADAETEHLWEISRAAMPRYHTFKTLIEKALRERNT